MINKHIYCEFIHIDIKHTSSLCLVFKHFTICTIVLFFFFLVLLFIYFSTAVMDLTKLIIFSTSTIKLKKERNFSP